MRNSCGTPIASGYGSTAVDSPPSFAGSDRWALEDLLKARVVAQRIEERMHGQFQALKSYLTGDEPQLSYSATARALGMSEGAVKVAVHRLRRKFRETVRDEIAQTVSSPAEIDDELRHLWSAVSR